MLDGSDILEIANLIDRFQGRWCRHDAQDCSDGQSSNELGKETHGEYYRINTE